MDSIVLMDYRTNDLSLRDYKSIIQAIKESSGTDLSDYAISSLRRRFTRFMLNHKIRDAAEFIARIRNGNGFVENLVMELTVNTTEMFRDPTFWAKLRGDVLSELGRKNRIHIWHAACSSGEEVFSMAIMLEELGILDKARIVATDINRNVLETARNGIYPYRRQQLNGRNYEVAGGLGELTDYYEIRDNQVHFNLDLIRNVDFRIHNLVQDGMISNFDLIICRNVLIYFNFELQEKVVRLFSQSLFNRGFLGIGSKESIIWCKESWNFSVISLKENIFRKKGTCNNEIYQLQYQ